MSSSPLVFIILTLVIDLAVDAFWGGINANTSYSAWNVATVITYQHLMPLAASASIAAKITS